MSEPERKKTTPELARARHLAERSATDLRLLSDATRAAKLPYSELSKVQRASREIKDLLEALGQRSNPETSDAGKHQETSSNV
jgi:hypothetical protein